MTEEQKTEKTSKAGKVISFLDEWSKRIIQWWKAGAIIVSVVGIILGIVILFAVKSPEAFCQIVIMGFVFLTFQFLVLCKKNKDFLNDPFSHSAGDFKGFFIRSAIATLIFLLLLITGIYGVAYSAARHFQDGTTWNNSLTSLNWGLVLLVCLLFMTSIPLQFSLIGATSSKLYMESAREQLKTEGKIIDVIGALVEKVFGTNSAQQETVKRIADDVQKDAFLD